MQATERSSDNNREMAGRSERLSTRRPKCSLPLWSRVMEVEENWRGLDTERGEMVEDWVAENNMVVLNDGSPTLNHKNSDKDSAPDITMVHASKADKFSWKTIDNLGSDHKPIVIAYSTGHQIQQIKSNPKYKWRLNKTDWFAYREEIEANIPREYSRKSVNKLEKGLRKLIIKSANKHIKKKKVVETSKPWFTEEINEKINKRNRQTNGGEQPQRVD